MLLRICECPCCCGLPPRAEGLDLTRLAESASSVVLRLDSGGRGRKLSAQCLAGAYHAGAWGLAPCNECPLWQHYTLHCSQSMRRAFLQAAGLSSHAPAAGEQADCWYRYLQQAQQTMASAAAEGAALLPPDWEDTSSTLTGTEADEALAMGGLTATQVPPGGGSRFLGGPQPASPQAT